MRWFWELLIAASASSGLIILIIGVIVLFSFITTTLGPAVGVTVFIWLIVTALIFAAMRL